MSEIAIALLALMVAVGGMALYLRNRRKKRSKGSAGPGGESGDLRNH